MVEHGKEAGIDFRILGPLEVWDADRPLPLGGAKQKGLLALLLLRANEVVSRDRLIDELWGERPPETATTALQVYVSQLRKLLEPRKRAKSQTRRLLTRAGGYVLRVEPGELDLARLERLLAEGRQALATGDLAKASAVLDEGLALWRGPPLADFAYEAFAQADISRLEELRSAALEGRMEAELGLGGGSDLVGELEALVARYPLRERLRAQLMLALYRSGRQAEALEAFQAARATLVEELGIEPGPDLQRLEKAILVQDPALELRLADGARDDAVVGPHAERGALVGRRTEVAELYAGLEDALAGRGRLFLVSGEPGIGKSRLADELANRARERGAQVLVGRCWEAGGAPAYWPWVQAIRVYLRERDREALRRELGAGGAELAQMVHEVRELFPDLPEPPSLDPEGARFRLFESTASFLRNAAEARPLVLVFDDLHAADAPSLLLLEFVAGELGESRILVLGAYRDVDPTLEDPLSSTLAELARRPVTRPLPLSGLPEPDVASFIELTAGLEPPQTLVAAIHRETEGNPLFVGEVVRLLVSEGRLADAGESGAWKLTIPHGVRAVIGRRLRRLSAASTDVLTLASVLGREFRLDVLERVIDVTGDELLEILDESTEARVVSEVPGALGRLRFAHALIRDVLYDALPPTRRVRLHRRFGEVLETVYASDPEPHLAELAYHFYAAAPGGPVDKAVDYSRRAGDRAVALLAYEEAARLYGLALEAIELKEAGKEAARLELLLRLGDAQARAGEGLEAKETFLQAAAAAKALDTGEQLARAALGYGGRFVWARAGKDVRLVSLLKEALKALPDADDPLRVRVLARLAGALRDEHERAPRDTLSREAVEMARRIGDPATLAYALDGRCTAIFWPENPEERMALATELVHLAEKIGEQERATQGRYLRAMFSLEMANIPTVRAELETVARLARELKQPAWLWMLVATQATLALFEGRFSQGEDLMDEALALGERAQGADAVLSYRIHQFTLRWQRGELDGLEEILTRAADEYPARPMLLCMLARLYADLSREADARRVFEELAADDFGSLPRTNEWLFSLGFLADVAEYLGDTNRARTAHELLSPYAARNASTADYISTGSVSRPLGVLAATLSRWEEAESHFEDALVMNEMMGARPWVAHTQHDYARTLLMRDRPDRARAIDFLAKASATYRELGMALWAERAQGLRGKQRVA